VLLRPLKGSDGVLLGMMSVDEPTSMLRPTDDDLDVLSAVSDHVALAIEEAQADAVAARHRASLQHLLQVSSRLTETVSVDLILQSVCDAIRRALGFQRVSIELCGPHGGAFAPRAFAGWGPGGPPRSGLSPETLTPLLDPAFGLEGCYLLPRIVARSRVSPADTYESSMNGAGPRAWHDHWLVVPLTDRDGALEGFIWVDDPSDRLLPSQEKLQALRLFANQATTALDSAARFEELQFLADHDPLTQLANRRAFIRQLEAETSRAHRYGHPFTLVLCDLDEFKALNDRAGHLVGDDHLSRFAAMLGASIRRADSAYRVGGDEFALILVETGEEDARRVVNRIAERLETDVTAGVRASFGVAVYEGAGDYDELFRRADEAMYLAKRSDSCVAVAA
jgi:diguanylate cyclase (GGDEF)-like protein